MFHLQLVPTLAFHLVAEAKILVLQFFVLSAKPLQFLMLFSFPAAAELRTLEIHKKARDKNAHHQSSGER